MTFWKILAFEVINRIKQVDPPDTSAFPTTEGLNITGKQRKPNLPFLNPVPVAGRLVHPKSVWWLMLILPPLRRLRQNYLEFMTSLDNIAKLTIK